MTSEYTTPVILHDFNMASTVKWEVVGKPVKKTKAQTQNGRQGKKVLGENTPRTEFGGKLRWRY